MKNLMKSPHIHVALATGISIIIMAYFSKRVLPQPIGYLPTALPPFIMAIFEAVQSRNKNSKAGRSRYWVAAILLSTAFIILIHAI